MMMCETMEARDTSVLVNLGLRCLSPTTVTQWPQTVAQCSIWMGQLASVPTPMSYSWHARNDDPDRLLELIEEDILKVSVLA